jgi:RNA 2',3'-cyclic 3'-phosphodiesterase
MPRLFTALAIPEDATRRISALRGGLPGARWIEPSDYHLTLRFIGDITDRQAREVEETLADTGSTPIRINLTEISSFGGSDPHSVHLVAEQTKELADLAAEHERMFRRLGLKPDSRRFVPHVTLARLRHGSPLDVADFIESRGHVAPIRFVADEFMLYSARASVGGGPYVVEAAYPLA